MLINEPHMEQQAGSLTIAVAQPEDIPALQEVAASSWWATYGAFLPATFIERFLAFAYSSSRLAAQVEASDSLFLVVKASNELLGFGQAGPPLPRHDNAPVAPADLHRLYLLPSWQRRGIGSQLLAALEAWLREQGYPRYGAYVHERNEPAKHFYARQNFARTPECDVQDEWYLVKRLDG